VLIAQKLNVSDLKDHVQAKAMASLFEHLSRFKFYIILSQYFLSWSIEWARTQTKERSACATISKDSPLDLGNRESTYAQLIGEE